MAKPVSQACMGWHYVTFMVYKQYKLHGLQNIQNVYICINYTSSEDIEENSKGY